MAEHSEKYRILVTGPPMAPEAMSVLDKNARVWAVCSQPSEESIVETAREGSIQGIIVRQGRISKTVLEASESLSIVVKHGVGADNIDVDSATQMGVPVCITPNANFESVAEHALALMLCLARNLTLHDRRLRNGTWNKSADQGSELFRKTLGIVGIGRIGKRLAELVKPLEMTVLAFDPFIPRGTIPDSMERVDDLANLLKRSDYLSIHCPKTERTVGLIGEKDLATMKSSAVLINTARGGIVNEVALLQALEDGRLGAAGLDCFEQEPMPKGNPLTRFEGRLVLTPHIGGATQEALVRMGTEAVQILLHWLDSGEVDPEVVLNPSVLEARS